MKLFGSYTSPFVRHVRIALIQSGMDFEFVEADYDMSAQNSPTAKVPYFEDGNVTLTDSSSILKYVREKAGGTFLKDIEDFELYVLADTLIDSAINVFMLENQGAKSDQFPYLARQSNRVTSGLEELNRRIDPKKGIATDSALRAACFIGWALFRNRITIDGLDNLKALMEAANQDVNFVDTAPPA